jgi:hypothetical protein
VECAVCCRDWEGFARIVKPLHDEAEFGEVWPEADSRTRSFGAEPTARQHADKSSRRQLDD